MNAARTRRDVVLVLAAVAALVLKSSYHGPLAGLVHDYGGNFAVSFAVYFLAVIAASRHGVGRVTAAAAALLAVEAFEVADGFRVMSNVYDPLDLVANAAGIGIALAVDVLTRKPAATAATGSRP